MSEVMKELLTLRINRKYGDSETESLISQMLTKEYDELSEMNPVQDGKRTKMYVISNEHKFYGAAVMLYPGFLADFAAQLAVDFYILPSSVHEIIVVPAQNEPQQNEFLKMVCEINATQVAAEEVLADSVYFCEWETGMITVMNVEKE
jgi:hypothetical protein